MQICELYVDGSAHPNPGPGGFGVVGLDLKKEISYIYNEQRDYTTNNEMELSAILFAMKNFGVQEGCAWEMQTPK